MFALLKNKVSVANVFLCIRKCITFLVFLSTIGQFEMKGQHVKVFLILTVRRQHTKRGDSEAKGVWCHLAKAQRRFHGYEINVMLAPKASLHVLI